MSETVNMNDVNEVLKVLDGHYKTPWKKRYPMDYEPEPLPVDVENVMKERIYADAANKNVFQEALKKLLSGGAEEVYLAFAYIEECLFQESFHNASFETDRGELFPLLREGISRNAADLAGTLIFWDGTMSKHRLERIIDVSDRYYEKYGFRLWDKERDAVVFPDDAAIMKKVQYIIKDGELKKSPNTELLRRIVVPEGVEKLGYGVFANHSRLENIVLPQSLREIGYNCFFGCKKLREISIPDGVEKIYEGVFRECVSLRSVELPDSVQLMNRMTFAGCTSLEYVKLPAGLKSIGEYTFSACLSLRRIELPSALEDIVHDAFLKCSSITEIDIPGSVKSIWFEAFKNCSALKKIRIPAFLRKLGKDVFAGCDSLETIEIYGELPSGEPVPEWLTDMACDDRSNARELLKSR